MNGVDFPLDGNFRTFILASDGANGFVGDDAYLVLWSISDLIELNPYYDDVDLCRRLLFFGSDGSSEGYAFVKASGVVVSIDFLDIESADPVKRGASFLDFLIGMSD